jgi:hypothetical protein
MCGTIRCPEEKPREGGRDPSLRTRTGQPSYFLYIYKQKNTNIHLGLLQCWIFMKAYQTVYFALLDAALFLKKSKDFSYLVKNSFIDFATKGSYTELNITTFSNI